MALTGFTFPGTGASDSGFGGVGVWQNPGNITADDGSETNVSLNASSSEGLRASNFGFSIPAGATIDGIEVRIECGPEIPAEFDMATHGAKMRKGASYVGDADTTDIWTSIYPTLATATLGDSTDLWGTTWTDSDINSSDFGVAITSTRAQGGGKDAFVDFISINVHYTEVAAHLQGGPTGGAAFSGGGAHF